MPNPGQTHAHHEHDLAPLPVTAGGGGASRKAELRRRRGGAASCGAERNRRGYHYGALRGGTGGIVAVRALVVRIAAREKAPCGA